MFLTSIFYKVTLEIYNRFLLLHIDMSVLIKKIILVFCGVQSALITYHSHLNNMNTTALYFFNEH